MSSTADIDSNGNFFVDTGDEGGWVDFHYSEQLDELLCRKTGERFYRVNAGETRFTNAQTARQWAIDNMHQIIRTR